MNQTEPSPPENQEPAAANPTRTGVVIRPATEADVSPVKRIFDGHRAELGWVPLPAVRSAQARGWLAVASAGPTLLGAIQWWARRDGVITLSVVAVPAEHRGQGIGRTLVDDLSAWGTAHGAHRIALKCPADLPANRFYAQLGFTLDRVDPGKRRPLHCWSRVLCRLTAGEPSGS